LMTLRAEANHLAEPMPNGTIRQRFDVGRGLKKGQPSTTSSSMVQTNSASLQSDLSTSYALAVRLLWTTLGEREAG